MMQPPPAQMDDLPDWIARSATSDDAGEAVLEGICQCLVHHGLPVWEMTVAAPTIDPQFRGATMHWRRDRPIEIETALHGPEAEHLYEQSPIPALLSQGKTFGRWNIAAGEGCDLHPTLDALRQSGCTDYVMFMVGFSPSTFITGTAVAVATDRSGGFHESDIAAFARLVPALGLAVYRQVLLLAATQALNSYLGPMTGAKVLAGQILRGRGETIAAAIVLADLSGFTSLTDREAPADVVQWLNEHLDAIGNPIIEQGGEILKFLGDGFLAVFPAALENPDACAACESAIRAAEQALAQNALVNAKRQAAGQPQLALHVALHFGEVIYGNVGTSRRLDFTTIGRAVNEASRIEKLCGTTGHALLISETFTRRCQRNFKALGSFTLRGVELPRALFTLG